MKALLVSRRGFLTALLGTTVAASAATCGRKSEGEADQRLAWLNEGSFLDGPQRNRFFYTLSNAALPPHSRFISDVRFAEWDVGRIQGLAGEIVAGKPDVIVSVGPNVTKAVSDATQRIPIVSIRSGDPARPGLLESLYRPGGNLTGVVDESEPFFYGQKLEFLKEAFPGIQRVVALIGTNPGVPLQQMPPLRDMQAAAARLGLVLEPVPVSSFDELYPPPGAAFQRVLRLRPDALIEVRSGVLEKAFAFVYDFTIAARLPAILDRVRSPLNYGPSATEAYAKGAEMVTSILKGTRPGDIPLWTAKMELVANLDLAQQMGLTIAPSVIAKADRVVQ